MAVIITDHRTIINEADAVTGWTGASALFTADPDPVEATGSIGTTVSTATADAYFTTTAQNLSDALVYVWVQPNGTMDTLTNGGTGIHLGDGTNRISFHVTGSDASGFAHASGPVRWTCAVIDTTSLPILSTVRAGSLANLNLSAITQIGATYKTLSKALGGASNCFTDIIRVGLPANNDGAMLTVTGGTSGAPGKFLEMVAEDRSTANQRAYGIIREIGSGLFSCQGALRFGNATGTDSSWFEESNTILVFENRGFATTRYKIVIRDNGTGTTTFKLGNKVGTGTAATGESGCNIIVPGGVGGEFDAQTDTNVTDVFLYGTTFSGFSNGFKMKSGQEFIGSQLTQSGTFIPSGALVYNSTVTNSTAVAAVEVSSVAEVDVIVNSTFSGNNRAIRITAAGTYTFDNLSFANNTNDIENASTGLVTINATNGSNVATFINTNGGTTVINNAVTFRVGNIREGSEIRIFRQSDLVELAGAETVGTVPEGLNNVSVDADPDNPGLFRVSYTYNYSADLPVFIVAHNLEYIWLRIPVTLTAQPGSIQIFQQEDRQYDFGSTP